MKLETVFCCMEHVLQLQLGIELVFREKETNFTEDAEHKCILGQADQARGEHGPASMEIRDELRSRDVELNRWSGGQYDPIICEAASKLQILRCIKPVELDAEKLGV